ncbi:unnamed protein product [Urochloa humidicola]
MPAEGELEVDLGVLEAAPPPTGCRGRTAAATGEVQACPSGRGCATASGPLRQQPRLLRSHRGRSTAVATGPALPLVEAAPCDACSRQPALLELPAGEKAERKRSMRDW